MITHKGVVEAIVADYKTFFIKEAPPLEVEFSNVSSPRVGSCLVKLPKEMEDGETDYDGAVFTLLVFCHEISHIINRHHDFREDSDGERIAVELWADIFSMKLALCVLTFGFNFNILTERPSSRQVIEAVSRAVNKLAETYHDAESSRYPRQDLRTKACLMAMTSFFTSLTGSSEHPWVMHYFRIVIRSPGTIGNLGGYDMDELRAITEDIHKVHLKIQGDRYEITNGMRDEVVRFLDTSFVQKEF